MDRDEVLLRKDDDAGRVVIEGSWLVSGGGNHESARTVVYCGCWGNKR